jgi:uncharacterized protein YcfJ
MAEELRLRVTDQPTWFNKEMAIGTLIFPIVGTLIGGYIGKNRMQKELVEGRRVSSEPSFWNKDTLLFGLLGGTVTSMLTFGLAVSGPGGLIAAAAMELGGMAVAGYFGGKAGEKRQVQDFQEAKKQHIVGQVSQNISPEIAEAVGYTMEHKKDWGQQVLEEKLLAATRDKQI